MAAKQIKFKLDPKPTFTAKVPVPIPGEAAEMVEFTFRHRTTDAMSEFVGKEAPKMTNAQIVMACASGWEYEEPFEAEQVERFNQNFPGGCRAVYETYCFEMGRVRLGN